MNIGPAKHARGRFASFDGTEIAYEVMAASPGSSRDSCDEQPPPVVCHHGFASDSVTNWVRPGVAAALVAAGHDTVLFDARGHGRSGKPHIVGAYEDGALARDVELLVSHLRLDRFDLVGYSMGSFVAMTVALSPFGRSRVRRLVLGGAGVGQASLRESERSGLIADALEAADPSSIGDRTARAFRSFADATGADRLALAALQRAHLGPPEVGDLARMAIPTLVVIGASDTMVGKPDSLVRAIPGARLALVPGDHLSAPVKPEFSRAIVEFLGEPWQ